MKPMIREIKEAITPANYWEDFTVFDPFIWESASVKE